MGSGNVTDTSERGLEDLIVAAMTGFVPAGSGPGKCAMHIM